MKLKLLALSGQTIIVSFAKVVITLLKSFEDPPLGLMSQYNENMLLWNTFILLKIKNKKRIRKIKNYKLIN